MLKKIKDTSKSLYREYKKYRSRSSGWKQIRNAHIIDNPKCAVCNSKIGLQVHHIVPFYENPSLELDKSNLITLCVTNLCHLNIGHGGDYKFYNAELLALIKAYKDKTLSRKELELKSLQYRKPNNPND